jgi:hypothetical protein
MLIQWQSCRERTILVRLCIQHDWYVRMYEHPEHIDILLTNHQPLPILATVLRFPLVFRPKTS